MGELINLGSFKKKTDQPKKHPGEDLNQLLGQATLLQQKAEEVKGAVAVMDFKKLKEVFEIRISGIILKTKKVDVEFFLCGNYVAALLAETGKHPPESWYAVDYFIKAENENNPAILKEGANVCFLICTVWPGRGNARIMKCDDYQTMGSSFYYNYYNQTGKQIAYFMSRQFKTMADITRQCLKEIN